jgi:hypothetical protein
VRRLTPYLLLGILLLGTGLAIGLGLSEAPSGIGAGPVPVGSTRVSSLWSGPSTQTGSAPSSFAERLAADIDQAPTVPPGVYHCPANSRQEALILIFAYPSRRLVTAQVAITGCDWVRIGLRIPSDNPGRGPGAARWVTGQLRDDLIALGAPSWARGRLTG